MAALNTSCCYHQTTLVSGTSRNVCILSISPSSFHPSSRLYQNSLKIQSFPSLQHTHYSNYGPQRALVSAVAARYFLLVIFQLFCFAFLEFLCILTCVVYNYSLAKACKRFLYLLLILLQNRLLYLMVPQG